MYNVKTGLIAELPKLTAKFYRNPHYVSELHAGVPGAEIKGGLRGLKPLLKKIGGAFISKSPPINLVRR